MNQKSYLQKGWVRRGGMLSVAIVLAGLFGRADANSFPFAPVYPQVGASGEERVGVDRFDAGSVVEVRTAPGFATHLILGEHEAVEDAAIGESDEWSVTARRGGRHVYFKPHRDAHTTNLVVTTSERSYNFLLIVLSPDDLAHHRVPTVELTLRSPNPEPVLARNLNGISAGGLEARASSPLSPFSFNTRYSMQPLPGSQSIAPLCAADDGRFIYLHFGRSAPIPAVFAVDAINGESLVNSHVEGEWVVIHSLSHRLMLRLGTMGVGVWNDVADDRPAPGVSHPPPLDSPWCESPKQSAPDDAGSPDEATLAGSER